MILPKNGRVIIIDDERDQAFPLISALSKYNIASTYFDAKKETLPINKFNDVRIVFLDINLNGGQQPNWNTEKSILISRISSIIEPYTPYILFVWSVNESDHFNDLSKLFDDDLLKYKPIIPPIKMGKSELFDMVMKDDGKSSWELKNSIEDTISFINTKLSSGLALIDSLEALLKWESVVNDSTALVVNDILHLANTKGEINEDLKQIYFDLAHAYWGKTLIGKSSDEVIAKSLINLNSILSDKVEYKLSKELAIKPLLTFPSKPDFNLHSKSQLNTRLLFSEDVTEEPLPGNLYLFTNEIYKKNIVENLIDRSTFSKDYCEENNIEKKDFYEGPDIKKEHAKKFTSYSFKKIEQVISEAIYMELELTPICDYSQDNRVFCRMVSGVILEEKYRKKQKKSASYFYVSPLFLMDGKYVNFYCDFRYIKSAEISSLKDIKPRLRIRHLFQTDIQSQMARQISRPGLVSL